MSPFYFVPSLSIGEGGDLRSSACAVFGGTYVLGKESIPESLTVNDDSVTIKIPCHPRPITAKHLVTSPDHLPPDTRPEVRSTEGNVTAHCIALLPSLPESLRRPKTESTEEEEGEDDTAVIVFPPTENQGLVRALVTGEGTGSCPAGQCTSSAILASGAYNQSFCTYQQRLIQIHKKP
jgi:RAB protein geranylgeranyltransferase component A